MLNKRKKRKKKKEKGRKVKRKNKGKKQALRNIPTEGRNLQGCLLDQLIRR